MDFSHDSNDPFFQRALPLALLGLRVHPLEPRNKKPLLQGYKRLATTDQVLLTTWAETYPDANVGIIVGERLVDTTPVNYVVLDVDRRRHGETSLATLEQMHPALPMTWQVQTGDGFHIYLALPDQLTAPSPEQMAARQRRASKELAPGIELLTAGCNLVGPGSIHPSTHVYQWMDCYDPASVAMAVMPHWLAALALEKGLLSEQRRLKSPILPSSKTPETALHPSDKKSAPFSLSSRVVLLAESAGTDDVMAGDAGCPTENLTGADVKALLGQQWVVQRCVRQMGIPDFALRGRKFHCIVHKDDHPSASLVAPRNPSEQWLYVDHHCKDDEPRVLPLPLAYYCKMTGAPTTTRLHTPELLVWSVRLLRDAGVLDGATVRAPKLPGDAPAYARTVYTGFQDLLSVKWRVTPGAASPFVWRFAERWTGLQEWNVGKGMKWLLSRGYLRFVQMDSGFYTFLPGTRNLIHRRKKRVHAEKQKQEVIIQDAQADVDAFLQDGETPRHQPHTVPVDASKATAGQCSHGASEACVDCELERIQARLLTKRREQHIHFDLADPFGLQTAGGVAC